ncbi:hypothetical protein [Chitinophaga vietnamensis]|uniref:hypothetical protein n=1 Tax=Chitinophaga vietnamensis TaxID=2593957 RepID=UPI0011783CC8|nr:hypothetical protein [Chitinophaga vietnamensis]
MKNNFLWKHPLLLLLVLSGLTLSSCHKNNDDTPAPVYNNDQLYAAAIKDAMVADSSEITNTLWPISDADTQLKWKTINGQKYVLMATFMRFPSSYPSGDSITTTWGEAWLFIPAQMKQKLAKAFQPGSDTIMRVCQLLGLPPVNPKTNTHIAEMWVNASRLYRPAGNPDITTTTTGPVLLSTVSQSYATWFNNYIIYAYYHTLQNANDYHYPWTRLGYTYDWAPGSQQHIGLSEYVMQASSGCWVEKVSRAADYFKN